MLMSQLLCAKRYTLIGQVQGVGFRPFVYHLATYYNVLGWVENRLGQVVIHAEAQPELLQEFEKQLLEQAPRPARPVISRCQRVDPKNYTRFQIRKSNAVADNAISIVADLPLCESCLKEMYNPNDRRYLYPFINCSNCGPRFTLIQTLPYDRQNTTMARFPLCDQCKMEYEDPLNRRFHAEPIACPECGPQVLFKQLGSPYSPAGLNDCVTALARGQVIAVKGVGGYHLICDAGNDDAVMNLRQRKGRPHKPLALMMLPEQLPQYVQCTGTEMDLLDSLVHPIVLLRKNSNTGLSPYLAPGLSEIGVMQAYSPLHHLILQQFNAPIVATSANISGEPVITDNIMVEKRLSHVADAFLHHNRPIQRPADDPVYRVIHKQPRPLRLGRGNAPVELSLPFKLEKVTLALGGHMKNTIALAWDDRVIISPHIGELDTPRSLQVFEQTIESLQDLYQRKAEQVVCDAHPGYSSHRWAVNSGLNYTPVWHHYAHASILAGEYTQEPRWLVFTWDGTGLGEDGTLWGGETLLGGLNGWNRVATMQPFYLPGGDKASMQPWRSAAALCWQNKLHWNGADNSGMLHQAWEKRFNCPQSSAVGRLFDAAASLLGLVHEVSFEAQGPMQLEALAENGCARAIPLALNQHNCENGDGDLLQTDWSPLLPMLLDTSVKQQDRARCFHESMAQVILQQALQLRDRYGQFAVGFSGGVFQNRLLSETAIRLLQDHEFNCYMPGKVPMNDAGLSYGQIVSAKAAGHAAV